MVYVLDTHAVVWFLEGSSRLSPTAIAGTCATTLGIDEELLPV
jgi:PIN domain nuclease of toxin-antitoxin system